MSIAEPDIRLFWWEGELYRGVKGEKARFYQELFDRGIVQHLIEKGYLIETTLTSLQADEYDLVLHHRRVPFVSYPFEWAGSMLRDAAMLVCNLQIELDRYGLGLKDPHSWNLLFDGPRPVYVDLGSVALTRGASPSLGYDSFCPFTLYPLVLMCEGHRRIARWLLHDGWRGITEAELASLVGKRSRPLRAKYVLRRAPSAHMRGLARRLYTATARWRKRAR